MVHLFDNTWPVLKFPVRWANSVTRWIQGVRSKTGTIKIANELDPGDGGSVSLDVDIESVAAKIAEALGMKSMTRDELLAIVLAAVDGASLEASNGRIKISEEWLAQHSGGGGSGTVTSVDGHEPDESGAVSFGLAASKWMKTDASGHISTTTDSPALLGSVTPSDVSTSSAAVGTSDKAARADHTHKLPSSVITTSDITKARLTSLGKGVASGTVTYVSEVTWNGTILAYKTKTLTVENGVITAIGTAATSHTIDTPVTYSP